MTFNGTTNKYNSLCDDLIMDVLNSHDYNNRIIFYQNNHNIYYGIENNNIFTNPVTNHLLILELEDNPIQVLKYSNLNINNIINVFNNNKIIKYIVISKIDNDYYLHIYIDNNHKNKYIPLPDIEMMKNDVFENSRMK